MPGLTPCKRREFIRKLRSLGYEGPFVGGNHGHMVKSARATKPGAKTVIVPNTDIDDVGLLGRILKNAKINQTDFIDA